MKRNNQQFGFCTVIIIVLLICMRTAVEWQNDGCCGSSTGGVRRVGEGNSCRLAMYLREIECTAPDERWGWAYLLSQRGEFTFCVLALRCVSLWMDVCVSVPAYNDAPIWDLADEWRRKAKSQNPKPHPLNVYYSTFLIELHVSILLDSRFHSLIVLSSFDSIIELILGKFTLFCRMNFRDLIFGCGSKGDIETERPMMRQGRFTARR